MQSGHIQSRWLQFSMRLDAKFWLAVLDQLRTVGINPDEASDEMVKAAIAEAEKEHPQ